MRWGEVPGQRKAELPSLGEEPHVVWLSVVNVKMPHI